MDLASRYDSSDESPYINRRRRVDRLNPKPDTFKPKQVIAMAFADSLELDSVQIKVDLMVPNLVNKVRLSSEVLRLDISKDRFAFLFDFGVAIFWGTTHDFSNRVVQMMYAHTPRRLPQIEIEGFQFKEGEQFIIANEMITLQSSEVKVKLAVSYAIAQSLQLSCFEETVTQMSEKSEKIQIVLAEKGEFSISHQQSTQEIAKLLDFNIQVNLLSNLLDTPDLLWDEDKVQATYDKVKRYLDVNKRISILNQRLEVMSELLWFFNSVHRARKLYNLDLTIMLLILVYVICEVFWGIIFRDILGNYRR